MINKYLNCYKLFIFFIFSCHLNFIYASVFTQPTLSRPTAPGKYGARELDWSASDNGELNYKIKIATPKLRQLDIDLAIYYSPANSYSEVGAFWGFNLSKVTLDTKRGKTKFLTSELCQNSKADNLFVDGTRMISVGTGVWVSHLNTARDVLRCQQNGFILYKSNGDILEYGSNWHAQVSNEKGQALEWYLTKIKTFEGAQEINYHYERPLLNNDNLGITKLKRGNLKINPIQFISKPLLKNVYADDVNVKISYENNEFKNPHFLGGFAQAIAGRVSDISVLKNENKLRNYKFEYEQNTTTPFVRLKSVQEFGSNGITALPKTLFSYRVNNFSFNKNIENVNNIESKSFPSMEVNRVRFADIEGIGRTQVIVQKDEFTLHLNSYEPAGIFPKDGSPGKLVHQSTRKVNLPLRGRGYDIQNMSFIDFNGTGVMDIFYIIDNQETTMPFLFLNNRKLNQNGEYDFNKIAHLSWKDFVFMTCEKRKAYWKFADFSGNGRTDFLCIKDGKATFLFNNGLKEVINGETKKTEIQTEQFAFRLMDLHYNSGEHLEVVDWNNDGLPDILQLNGIELVLYLNNGSLAQGERSGEFFEKISLGRYPYEIADLKIADITIGDFTGTGLPSINFHSHGFLINNGLGKQLTYVKLGSLSIQPKFTAVTQFTGDGKHQIITASHYFLNKIIEFPIRSFPNHLHSVATSDGKFLTFNYSSSVLENNEAIKYDTDSEIKQIESNYPIFPIVVPLLKQTGLSDGFNPTKMWRYSYRIPNYDRAYKKFLGFSLVRKQAVGDKSQLGSLTEKRLLSGYRISEQEKIGHIQDIRLTSEKQVFSLEAPYSCTNSSVSIEQSQWCTDLAGYSYFTKTGAALNDTSFATGQFSKLENVKADESKLSLKFIGNEHLIGIGNIENNQVELAQILEDKSIETVSGDHFLNYSKIIKTENYYYDSFSRLVTKVQNNSSQLNGDNLVTNYTYFCPLSHPENPQIFCDKSETTTTASSLSSVKPISQKIIYDFNTGLPLQEWATNQNGNLVLQTSVQYDKYARIIEIKKATGANTFIEWEEGNSNLNVITDQDNLKTTAKYNELGFLSLIENSRGNILKYTYDSLGRVLNLSKNLPGTASLEVENSSMDLWDTIIQWVKNIFSMASDTTSTNSFADNRDNKLYEFEKYEYQFPTLNFASEQSFEHEVNKWNQFDQSMMINSNPENYNVSSIGNLNKSQINPGYIHIYRRNNEKENLTLISKIWLSGVDEPIFSASRMDNNRFSVSNKSSVNSLGKVYQDYLNSEISFDDVLKNNLPDSSDFKLKSTSVFYSDGSIASHEYDTNIVQRFIQGVDFNESISPEGRRTKKIFNDIGQLKSQYLGLDANGNISHETLITNIEYDALGRLHKLTNNDGFEASQIFGSNNLVELHNNNGLGISRFFYDEHSRLSQSILCPVGTQSEICNNLATSVLFKEYKYNAIGRLDKEEHTRFNRNNGTQSKEIVHFKYGSMEKNNRVQDIGLPISVSVFSSHDLGISESIRNFAYNQEGAVAAEDLELFLNEKEGFKKKSLGVYQLEKSIDLAGNTTQIRSRGGFSREKLNQLKGNYFTGYSAQYEEGTSLVKHLNFIQNGVIQSVPLQNVQYDAQGYTKQIDLENNLQLLSCWHKRKEVPLAFWAGNKQLAPNEICDENSAQNTGIFHSKWNYDNDLFPISTKDFSAHKGNDPTLSSDSLFKYDTQGRLVSAKGIGDDTSSWGHISYEYSIGGRINKVTRSGNMIKNRVSKHSNSLIDTYSYSTTGQFGVLQGVTSSDGFSSAFQTFSSDSLGFREFGVAPTLAILTPTNLTENNNNNNNFANTNLSTSSNWQNKNEIPMQKYVWNGRGQLAGVFAGVLNNKNELETNELLNFRMSDENGGQLAEFDGVTYQKILNDDTQPQHNSDKKNELTIQKLARSVSFSQGITFERDEIHFNIGIGSFANLRLITRYPALNSADPNSLSSLQTQTRKELVVKDHVGSVSQVIDIDSHKIVERNASEPFGLSRGIPLLTNSTLSNYKDIGNRKDVSLYTNPQSNMREEWEGKSFEILGSSNSNELQGMRGTEVFAKGKFSASTGLSNMGVRTLDSARGVWLSPDLYMAKNLEGIVDNPLEANLFQYANNNPITNNDPTGMASWNDTKSKINDACNGKVSGGKSGHDMTKSPGNGGNNDKNSNNSSNGNDKGSQNSNGFKDFLNNAANTVKNYGTEISNKLSEMGARINSAISKPEMAACGFIAGTGLVSLSLGIGNTAAATGGAPFTAGLSLGIIPATTSQISSGFLMASSGLGCMSGLLFNAAIGSGKSFSNKECSYLEPRNLQDKMVMDAVKNGQFDFNANIPGVRINKVPIKLNDPRFLGMEKMQLTIESAKGVKTNIHYTEDKTGNKHDIKFKGPCQ